MNIVDYGIILFLLIFIAKGFKNGVLKELVTFGGGIIIIVLSYILKNPVSVILYQNLPFFKFGGTLAGISVINILIYELLAFLIVAGILTLAYKILLRITNVIETILKATVILEIPSKLLGLILGAIEGVIFSFIVLFVLLQFPLTKQYIDSSKYGNTILTKIPVLSSSTEKVYTSLKEIYDIADKYKDYVNKDEANLQALDTLLKYEVIKPSNVDILIGNGKLDIPGAKDVVKKYDK